MGFYTLPTVEQFIFSKLWKVMGFATLNEKRAFSNLNGKVTCDPEWNQKLVIAVVIVLFWDWRTQCFQTLP